MKIRSIYSSKRWQKARRKALDRAKWRCERCQKPGRLEVHHKTSIWVDISKAFVQANLETLCRDCHIAHHRLEKLAKNEGKPKNAPVQEPWLDFVNELA